MHSQLKNKFINPLISGSFIVMIGTTVGNAFNYFFHVSMGRILTPADYGILMALISFISIFGILTATITTVVIKFVSSSNAVGSLGEITHILRGIYKKIIFIVFFGIIIFQFLFSPIESFLNIHDRFLLNISIIGVFLGFFGAINSGALQGLQKFHIVALLGSGGSLLRLTLALIFVYLGFGIRGAVVGLFLSFFLPYILTFIPLKKYFFHKESRKRVYFREVLKYSFPVLVAFGGLSSFINTDIILVKHFFSDIDAGHYAALSVIGRVIFFGTSSISLVMFPIIAAKYEKRENYNLTFLLSFFLVFIASSSALVFYFIIPKILIQLLYSQRSYLTEAGNLGLMGVFYTVYSLASLFISFFLSISKVQIVLFSVLTSILQIVLIWNFHDNIRQVITSSVIASAVLLVILVLYYIYYVYNAERKK